MVSEEEERLQRLAKRLLAMPHKPREKSKLDRAPSRAAKRGKTSKRAGRSKASPD